MKILRYISLSLLLVCSPALMAMQSLQQKQQAVAAVQRQEAQKLAQEQEKRRQQLAEQEAQERRRKTEEERARQQRALDRNLGTSADKNIGAGVLPITDINGVKYVVLGEESTGSGWSLFGGRNDQAEQPLTLAARECWEEMNADITLGMTAKDMYNYVNSDNTEEIIALHHGDQKFYTCYVTRFDSGVMEILQNTFRTQYHRITHQEIKNITFVAWNELERVIKGTEFDREKDKTYDVKTKNGNTIRLRDVVVKMLRPYFKNPQHNHKYMKW